MRLAPLSLFTPKPLAPRLLRALPLFALELLAPRLFCAFSLFAASPLAFALPSLLLGSLSLHLFLAELNFLECYSGEPLMHAPFLERSRLFR